MKKSLLGTAIAAKEVKYAFTDGSTVKVALRFWPGSSGSAIEPMTAVGSAAANAGNQAEPLPPSAIETIAAVATWPMLKASKLPLLKPRRSGAKLMLLVGARFWIVTVTLSGTALAAPAAVIAASAATLRIARGRMLLDMDMGRLLRGGGGAPETPASAG